jgi:hypothetical protein
MIQQVRQLRSTDGARAFALALIATSLVALAGVAGYEVGTGAGLGHPAAVFQTVHSGQEAPPDTGLQP